MLSAISGFNNLNLVKGDLVIERYNDSLVSLQGFENLNIAEGEVSISENYSLSSNIGIKQR